MPSNVKTRCSRIRRRGTAEPKSAVGHHATRLRSTNWQPSAGVGDRPSGPVRRRNRPSGLLEPAMRALGRTLGPRRVERPDAYQRHADPFGSGRDRIGRGHHAGPGAVRGAGAVAGGVLGMGSHERRGPMDRDGPVLLHQRRADHVRGLIADVLHVGEDRGGHAPPSLPCRVGGGEDGYVAISHVGPGPQLPPGRLSHLLGKRASRAERLPASVSRSGKDLSRVPGGRIRAESSRGELPPDAGRAPGSRLCSVRSLG